MIRSKEDLYNELLALRCRRGDRKAFEELIAAWECRLFYYIRRFVSNEQDAWDTLQDVWIKVLREIGRLRYPLSLPAWLYRIARNTAVSRLRHELTRRELIDDQENPDDKSNHEESFTFDDAERVHRGLGMIPLAHREVLTLHFLEDMTVDEIAEVLDVPSGTVKSRLYYAKRALREALEKGELNNE